MRDPIQPFLLSGGAHTSKSWLNETLYSDHAGAKNVFGKKRSLGKWLTYSVQDNGEKSVVLRSPSLMFYIVMETQVIEVTEGAEPREQRIALSMKLVNQSDGTDLDPSNAEAETDVSECRYYSCFGRRFLYLISFCDCVAPLKFVSHHSLMHFSWEIF